jgi:hypothetical protein
VHRNVGDADARVPGSGLAIDDPADNLLCGFLFPAPVECVEPSTFSELRTDADRGVEY